MNPGADTSGGEALLRRRQQSLGPAYRLFYEAPLHIVRGEGVHLFDADGNRYLDFYNNVPHVGHCHPKVVEAICRQAGELNTHTRYLHENVVRYAERLLDRLPDALDIAMFSCTGSEANELALRVARAATGKEGIVVIEQAYHGTTRATFEISTEDIAPERRPPHVATVSAPDAYRGKHHGGDAAELYAAEVRDAIAALEERGAGFAAFIIDTIASSSGVVEPPPGYLAAVSRVVRDAGGVFIADEVQPGLGRTGRTFWGFEADGVEPDIVTLGKPLGNGHPLAATILRRELVDAFSKQDHYFNTFGGNPVSAAAGLAVLDVMEAEDLQQNALNTGQRLKAGLRSLAGTHQLIGDVRGNGLFLGVELVEDRASRRPATDTTREVVNGLKARGILTNMIGPDANVLKIRPPLVLAADQADEFLQQLDAVLAAQ